MYKIPLYFLKELMSVLESVEKSLTGELQPLAKERLLKKIQKIKAPIQRLVGSNNQ
jgi:hypothetical protein